MCVCVSACVHTCVYVSPDWHLRATFVAVSAQEDKLKTAILDYLKRFHSEDRDTYSMVALYFSMYREIAQVLDESGHRNLALLKDKPLGKCRGGWGGGLFVSSAQKQICGLLRWEDGGGAVGGWRGGL